MKSSPSCLTISKGAQIDYQGREYIVTHIVGLDKVLARCLETGELETIAIAALQPHDPKDAEKDKSRRNIDLEDVSKEDWDEAKRRLKMLEPLLRPTERGTAEAIRVAKSNGIGQATLYRWRRDYINSGLLSSLLPVKKDGGKGKARLKNTAIEAIIKDTVENYFLTDAHPSVAATHEKIKEDCKAASLKPPHYQTVRRRILWRAGRTMTALRYGEKAARELHDAIDGQIPDANWPLALIQIDHTELPVMIVHDVTRRPIGRPWVTFAIDVFSRVVPGMYLSLDHPSSMSAGMCISQAILPKEKWLADRKIDAEWPCWGVMGILHMDNAKEFRGNMLRAACDEYTIDLHLRPVKTPHYGAHIERLMGTVSEELKKVPGATFSNPRDKGEYDSEGNAIMTLTELERWLVYFIGKYHHRLHTGIGTSPLIKYKEGLLGTKGRPGRGLPARRLDEEKVRIDFMPYEERTIQDYGVQWDVHYFSDVLRTWVNTVDPNNPRLKRQFRFRRDPRDISEIYFFEPNAKQYYGIPYRDLSLPPISLWEFRDAKRAAKADGLRDIDERVIFRYAMKMREEVEQSAGKTKSARRKQQRIIEHEKARKKKKDELPKVSATPKPIAPPPKISGYDPSQVTPFDEDD